MNHVNNRREIDVLIEFHDGSRKNRYEKRRRSRGKIMGKSDEDVSPHRRGRITLSFAV